VSLVTSFNPSIGMSVPERQVAAPSQGEGVLPGWRGELKEAEGFYHPALVLSTALYSAHRLVGGGSSRSDGWYTA
jgi:hypothetical protein